MAARIRMSGVADDSLIPTPPVGKATLFYNNVLKVYRAKLDDGSVITLSADVELIQDTIAAAIASGTQDGIDVVYDDPGNSLSFVNIDKGSVAVTNHEAALDPHPQYETSAESQAKVDAHANLTNNPHSVTATQVGLGNVDNTSDANKPVSTAQATADVAVQAFSIQRANHTGTQDASTITGLASVATSGNKADIGLGNVDDTSDANKPVSTAQQAALDLKYDASNPDEFETPAQLDARDTANRSRANHTGTQLASTISDFNSVASLAAPVQSIASKTGIVTLDKSDVGLNNVDNTSDFNKPISTATQAALNLKENIFNPANQSIFFDDFFIGLNTSLGWTVTSSGAGTSAVAGSYGTGPTNKPLGIQRLSTGTTTTGRLTLNRAVNGFVFGLCSVDQIWRVALEQLSTPAQRFVSYVGFHDLTGAGAPSEGAYFVYADSLGPNWLCITRDNNVQTAIDSGVATNISYNKFRILVNEAGTQVQFFINDVLVGTSNTNVPNNVNRQTGIACRIESITGTTPKFLNIDYYYHKLTITGGRM